MERQIRERASALFNALGHPTRIRIIEILKDGEKTVNEIALALEIQQSGASQHIAVLHRAGILAVEPKGASRYYRLRGPRVPKILELIEEFCMIHSLYGYDEEIENQEETP